MKPGDGILSLITAPTFEPVTLAEAKEHLNLVGDSGQDDWVEREIAAARQHVENITGRALAQQTWDWLLPEFGYWDGTYRFDGTRYPGAAASPAFTIPKAPLLSVTHIKYVDSDGAEQTIGSSDYRVIAPVGPACGYGLVDPISTYSWPSIASQRDAVRIRFVAGYPSTTGSPATADDVPGPIKDAIMLLISDRWENREAQAVGVSIAENPALMRLLDEYILRG